MTISRTFHNSLVSKSDIIARDGGHKDTYFNPNRDKENCPHTQDVTSTFVPNLKTGEDLIIPDDTKPRAQPKESRLIKSTKAKNDILQKYQSKYGSSSNKPITAKVIGEPTTITSNTLPSYHTIVQSSALKPCGDKYYRVQDINIYHVLVVVLVNMRDSLNEQDIRSLSLFNDDFAEVVPQIIELLDVDISPILRPRLEYQNQTEVDPHRVTMATAALVGCGMDPGKCVRLLNQQYTGEDRPSWKMSTLNQIRGLVSQTDLDHIKRILTQGCPAKLQLTESYHSKLRMMRRGNQKHFDENPELVKKTVNKEDKHSHLIPVRPWCCQFSPYLRHNVQGLVMKEGKEPRVVWDGSTLLSPEDLVMNDVTSTDYEADITFGTVEQDFYRWIYNLRVTYPDTEIYLATLDVKACFRYPRINPDLTGAFGFFADEYFCLATAMVFGSNTSATSWEPFRRAIEALTISFAKRTDLVEKHGHFLDMIAWNTDPALEPFVKAFPCEINPGIVDVQGNLAPIPAMFYVDDALIAAPGLDPVKQTLAATIEAIFVTMGEPDNARRQCSLAMDKWRQLIVGPNQTFLGLEFNARRLTVAIPSIYTKEALAILDRTWHAKRQQFFAGDASKLVGKLARLAKGAPWVYFLISHLYGSIAFALGKNKEYLEAHSKEFQHLVALQKSGTRFAGAKTSHDKIVRFAIKQAARSVHHSRRKYDIVPTMRAEIEFFRRMLQPNTGLSWETPIAHLIKRVPSATAFGDACLDGAGGYSIDLCFWWHLEFPQEIVERTLKYKKDNKAGDLISINVLEFLTVILNYCAAYTVFTTERVSEDPFPVILNVTDNMSALNWTTHTCKCSQGGRLLARTFCSLLIGSPVGINAKWISTHDNEIADQISRLKKETVTNSPQHFSFDYKSLPQRFPELKRCRLFQPEPKLVSLLCAVVLEGKWPSHDSVQKLKQSGLGKLFT